MGEEGQDGWCVLWLTLGPPDPGMELYWWYGGRGGSVSTSRIRSWCSQGLGEPSEVVLGMSLQARVRMLGRLKYGVGSGGGCSPTRGP